MPITHLMHDWQIERDTGVTVYELCPACNRRQAWQRHAGIEPVDTRWVRGGEFRPSTPAHNPPPTVWTDDDPDIIDRYAPQRRSRYG